MQILHNIMFVNVQVSVSVYSLPFSLLVFSLSSLPSQNDQHEIRILLFMYM